MFTRYQILIQISIFTLTSASFAFEKWEKNNSLPVERSEPKVIDGALSTEKQAELTNAKNEVNLLTYHQWRTEQIQIAIKNIVSVKTQIGLYKSKVDKKSAKEAPQIEKTLELMMTNLNKYPQSAKLKKDLEQAELHLVVVRKLGPMDYFELYLENYLEDPRIESVISSLSPGVMKEILLVLSKKKKEESDLPLAPKSGLINKSAMR